MSVVDHDLLPRLLTRSEEVGAEPGMKSTVVLVYQDVLAPPAQAYLTASSQLKAADADYIEKAKATAKALEKLDAPYREARSVVAAYLPSLELPATLKSQPTDTDQRNAIKELQAVVAEHKGQKWADALLSGTFGQQAPKAIEALDESISAGKVKAAAHQKRTETFEPAYAAFLSFKQVVRNGLGAKSKQHQRLRLRQKGVAEQVVQEEVPVPKPQGATAGATTTTTTGGTGANGTSATTTTGATAGTP